MAVRFDPSAALHTPDQAPRTLSLRSRLGARDRWLLLALLLGAALIRIAVIWMPSDQMLENGHLPFEEVLRGNAAADFLNGTLLPLLDYQVNHFSGGSLVVSILAAPLFLVLGPVFPVLRLVSLCFSIPLVLMTFALVDRWKGRSAAWIAASLIAFAPPGYQFLNCTVYGTHIEGNCVTIALVFLYLGWRERNRREGFGTFCLGVASGFAVWFGYGQCVVLGVLLLVEVAASGWRAALSLAPRFALGFLTGLAPWILYMLRHPEQMLRVYERSIVEHFGSTAYFDRKLEVLGNLFVLNGPRAFWLHGAHSSAGLLVAHVFVWAVVAVLVRSFWLERGRLAALFRALVGRDAPFQPTLRSISLLFVSAWLGAFCLSDFRVESDRWIQDCRYLMPLLPFLAILTGLLVEDVGTRRVRMPAIAAIVLVMVVNAGATIAQLRPDRMAQHAHEPATSMGWHVRMIVRRYGTDGPTMLSVVQRIDSKRTDPERTQLVDWIARGLARTAAVTPEEVLGGALEPAPFASTLRFLAEHAPEHHRSAFARRLGAQSDPSSKQ